MYLIELFLPLADNEGAPFSKGDFDQVEHTLAEMFGGVTAYPRAPARGLWNSNDGERRDELIVYEVMTENLDRQWWADYRLKLERRFRQEKLVFRLHPVELI